MWKDTDCSTEEIDVGTEDGLRERSGKRIDKLEFIKLPDSGKDSLRFTFDDGKVFYLYDDFEPCCDGSHECRYMVINDDLSYFAGSIFLGAEVSPLGAEGYDDFEYHDIEFLNVRTSKGVISVSTHIEHNGYYGGFAILFRSA